MRIGSMLLCVTVCLAGCGDRDIGYRYRAERELWNVEREHRRVSSDPEYARRDRCEAVASRYETLVGRYLTPAGVGPSVQLALQRIVAKAWLNAAELHALALDSVRVDQILVQMTNRFDAIPEVSGEVAFLRGQIAEIDGDPVRASSFYQHVIELIEPEPGADGVAGTVMELPLRIAQVRAEPSAYERAGAYYRAALDHGTPPVQVVAQTFLARVAADQGQWDEANGLFDELERRILQMDESPLTPAEVRFAALEVWIQAEAQGHADSQDVRIKLDSLVADYPQSSVPPRALFIAAKAAHQLGHVEEALRCLSVIGRDYPFAENRPDAELLKGRLLAKADRWGEALRTLKALPVEFPISRAALSAPLEIADHFARQGDRPAVEEALTLAEKEYRDFLVRFPVGTHTHFARERLADTYGRQGRHEQAVSELLALSQDLQGTRREMVLLVRAARLAKLELPNTVRAATILDQIAVRFPNTRTGVRAAAEANELRGATPTP